MAVCPPRGDRNCVSYDWSPVCARCVLRTRRKRTGPGGPPGLQNRSPPADRGRAGFDSQALPPFCQAVRIATSCRSAESDFSSTRYAVSAMRKHEVMGRGWVLQSPLPARASGDVPPAHARRNETRAEWGPTRAQMSAVLWCSEPSSAGPAHRGIVATAAFRSRLKGMTIEDSRLSPTLACAG